jgi:ubiquitin carboxyl-terminal hydrolase 25
LGAVGDLSDSLIEFAFDRQVAADPDNYDYYLECLQGIARGRNSDSLTIKYATALSLRPPDQAHLEEAFRYFGLDPRIYTTIGDDEIIGNYRSRLGSVPVYQEEEMRRMLRIIGDARQSEAILAEASNGMIEFVSKQKTLCLSNFIVAVETFAQAISWLGVEENTDDDLIVTCYSMKVSLPDLVHLFSFGVQRHHVFSLRGNCAITAFACTVGTSGTTCLASN